MSTRTILSREILRYEIEVCKDDLSDPIRPRFFRTQRAMFYKQCAQAWRGFALAIEMIEQPPGGSQENSSE